MLSHKELGFESEIKNSDRRKLQLYFLPFRETIRREKFLQNEYL